MAARQTGGRASAEWETDGDESVQSEEDADPDGHDPRTSALNMTLPATELRQTRTAHRCCLRSAEQTDRQTDGRTQYRYIDDEPVQSEEDAYPDWRVFVGPRASALNMTLSAALTADQIQIRSRWTCRCPCRMRTFPVCTAPSVTPIPVQCIGSQRRHFAGYTGPCQLFLVAILWVKLGEMFVTAISLKYVL